MLYQMELLARERHERMQREAEERNLLRLAGGRPQGSARTIRAMRLPRLAQR